jgi:diguanylate cyclase (GGDEF)-like protein/PAS domain S-box-containing protein
VDDARREELLQAERLLHTIVATCPAAITIHDAATGAATYANERWQEITGQPMSSAMGFGWLRMLHREDRDHFLSAGTRARAAKESYHVRYRMVRTDGEVRWLDARVGVVLDELGEVGQFVAITSDVTRAVRDQAELAHLSAHDQLTGLPNRLSITRAIDEALTAADPDTIAVLFCDLDWFKPINDRFGHAVGDLALKTAARRIATSVKASDMAGRFGGDEFVVLLRRVPSADAAFSIADRIVAKVSEPMILCGHQVSMSVSIGVVLGGADDDAAALLRRADAEMYRVKSTRAVSSLAR